MEMEFPVKRYEGNFCGSIHSNSESSEPFYVSKQNDLMAADLSFSFCRWGAGYLIEVN